MDTGRAIIIGAAIIAATGAATAWAVQPRYSTSSPGGGVTVRLDKKSGDMIGCERLACRAIVKGAIPLPVPTIPPPPAGYVIDNSN